LRVLDGCRGLLRIAWKLGVLRCACAIAHSYRVIESSETGVGLGGLGGLHPNQSTAIVHRTIE
jgi:hypothetical protein